MTPTTTERRFIPTENNTFNPAEWATLEPLFDQLLGRELPDSDAAADWLADLSELTAAIHEYASRRNIDYACHTDDETIEKAYMHYVENIAPKLAPIFFKLQQKLLASPGCEALEQSESKFAVLLREWRTDVDIFREANVPIRTKLTKLNSEYDKLIGAMQVEYNGKKHTLQQLARFLEETDRAVREETWRLSTTRRLQDREAIETIFEEMLSLRAELASNADESDYRAFAWKQKGRFDYTPKQCDDFADAVEKLVMPVVEKLDQERAASLGIDALRPWDGSVDLQGRPPLRPFEKHEDLLEGAHKIFNQISPMLGDAFGKLEYGRNLDLDSRPGKRAGGFQASLPDSGEPFIFMNAAGLQRDVDTLLHEGGHAFHFVWAHAAEPLLFLQHAPLEFCEVASMSMELVATDFMDAFYNDDAQIARAIRTQFEGILRILPWIATIDQFQHWLYTHENHTRDERTEVWLNVLGRFSSSTVDWSGLEEEQAAMWQKQLHLFHHPFYYIEYGIAQLGALQLWLNYQNDPKKTLEQYRAALTLGGTQTLPKLFEAAGLKFDFSSSTIAPLMEAIATKLEQLPA